MTTYHPDTVHPTQNETNGADKQGMADAARDQFDKTQAQVRETADLARRQVNETAQRASHESAQFVRDNPAMALFGAVAFGVLIGVALRGR